MILTKNELIEKLRHRREDIVKIIQNGVILFGEELIVEVFSEL
jgi:hypothetical protein